MDSYRYVSLSDADGNQAVIGLSPDGEIIADERGYYLIFILPRIAEDAADAFRAKGWVATVCEIGRY